MSVKCLSNDKYFLLETRQQSFDESVMEVPDQILKCKYFNSISYVLGLGRAGSTLGLMALVQTCMLMTLLNYEM